jgi:hypothetical protein
LKIEKLQSSDPATAGTLFIHKQDANTYLVRIKTRKLSSGKLKSMKQNQTTIKVRVQLGLLRNKKNLKPL